MEKISQILPASKRVPTVVDHNAQAVRPGAYRMRSAHEPTLSKMDAGSKTAEFHSGLDERINETMQVGKDVGLEITDRVTKRFPAEPLIKPDLDGALKSKAPEVVEGEKPVKRQSEDRTSFSKESQTLSQSSTPAESRRLADSSESVVAEKATKEPTEKEKDAQRVKMIDRMAKKFFVSQPQNVARSSENSKSEVPGQKAPDKERTINEVPW